MANTCNGDCANCIYDDCIASQKDVLKFVISENKEKRKNKKEKQHKRKFQKIELSDLEKHIVEENVKQQKKIL